MPLYTNYAAFADALQRTCVISDPWVEGAERFCLEPVVISIPLYERLAAAAEAIGMLYEELCQIVWEHSELLDTFFHLTPYQKLMWLSSGGRWHGIARLDLFVLPDGSIQCCEMNSDTPSGEAEAVLLNNMLFSEDLLASGMINPNKAFPQRFASMVHDFSHATLDFTHIRSSGRRLCVGIIYPTEMTEDLSMIQMYRVWLEQAGFDVVIGSPFNLHRLERTSLAVGMFGQGIDIALRHYKTDWWGEREPVWRDVEGFPDPEPLVRQLHLLVEAEHDGALAIINPFGAALTQNKLTMAFFWRYRSLFSARAQNTIECYIPETIRLCDADIHTLTQNDWVLKSDYGCEGDEVVLGCTVTQQQWDTCLAMAVPERWIVQRFFEVAPLTSQSSTTVLLPNIGIYLLGGVASGVFTRLSSTATDYKAISAPTFLHPSHSTLRGAQ
jgi:glutathionylspermidine synthase